MELNTQSENVHVRPERHALPPLPYEYDALEPYIDERTMRLHHDVHHRAYVDALNRAEAALSRARRHRDWTALNYWQRQLAFNGSAHFLHSIFWSNMHPNGGGRPTDEGLMKQIERDFGSFDAFRAHFTEAANALDGSGWVLLVWQPMAEKLEILQTEQHHCPAQWTAIPVLVLDLWEHAYYMQYRTRRPDYIESWWNVVNWPGVARRLREARKAVVSGGADDGPRTRNGREGPVDGDGSNGDGDAGPPRGAGPTAPDTPDDGTPPPGRRDEPPRDEKRRPHAATKDDVVTPSGGAARPGATVYAGDEVSPGDLLGPEDMWWPEGARPSDNPRPPADSGTGPDDTHRPRAETSSPGDAPPPGEDGTHRPRGAAADETFIPDEDPADVQTMYGTAAAVRRAARSNAVKGGMPARGGTVRYVYGRRSSPRW